MELFSVLVLVGTFLLLLITGVPVAYCIGISSVITLLLNISLLPALTTFAQRMATGLDSFTLLAIPFFVLSGQLMNQGGIARRLIDLAKALVGRLPGGLAYVNVLACMLFGAISGSAVAATSAIGTIMSPRMKEEGYTPEYGAAVNITSSTTGLIIPPSNILIVYSLASGGTSIAALFLAGYVPGILVGLLLMVVAGYVAYRHRYGLNKKAGQGSLIMKLLDALPSLLLLVVVIGGIIAGIFTATEASAIAVLYTLVLTGIYREITLKDLPGILLKAVSTTSVVMLLIATSMGMSWVMSFEHIPQNVSMALLNLSENPIVILLVINAILLFVGTFMDMTPAVLIFTPIFLPVVTEIGMDPVQYGIMMILNLCVGVCTPPVGTALFVGCSVADISITKVIKPILPFYLVMIVTLLLVTFIPGLALWLPEVFGF